MKQSIILSFIPTLKEKEPGLGGKEGSIEVLKSHPGGICPFQYVFEKAAESMAHLAEQHRLLKRERF